MTLVIYWGSPFSHMELLFLENFHISAITELFMIMQPDKTEVEFFENMQFTNALFMNVYATLG